MLNVKFTNNIKICFGKLTTKATIALFICFISGLAYAGAWTQQTGKWLTISNFSYYSTNKYFDNSGKQKPLASYKKFEINPYIEYGLRDDVTVGANLFFQQASQYNGVIGTDNNNIGIGDSEFFTRFRLWQKDGAVFSIEPMVKLPSLESSSEQPQIGSRNFDTGLTFSAGYGFKKWDLDHFINLDAGYRHRFGMPSDQLKINATAGLSVSKNTMLLTQVFNTARLASHNNAIFTQSSGDDYDLTKLQISAIYKIDDKLSLQAGAFSNIAGKNSGGGDGMIFAINKSF